MVTGHFQGLVNFDTHYKNVLLNGIHKNCIPKLHWFTLTNPPPYPTGHDTTVIVLYNVTVVTGIFLQNVLVVISIVVFLFNLKSSECC